jgi:hypothetical protein
VPAALAGGSVDQVEVRQFKYLKQYVHLKFEFESECPREWVGQTFSNLNQSGHSIFPLTPFSNPHSDPFQMPFPFEYFERLNRWSSVRRRSVCRPATGPSWWRNSPLLTAFLWSTSSPNQPLYVRKSEQTHRNWV